jgi:hypothetical protein
MQSPFSSTPQTYSEQDIKQAISSSSQTLANQLNPDYPIYHQKEIIRFGNLPLSEQEALKQALLERTQDQLIKYQF